MRSLKYIFLSFLFILQFSIDAVYLEATLSCVGDGLFKTGFELKDNITAEGFAWDCTIGAMSALLADEVSKQLGDAVTRFHNSVKQNPRKFIAVLERLGIPQNKIDEILGKFKIPTSSLRSIDELLASLEKKIDGDVWEAFKADFGNDADLLQLFDDKIELVEAWKMAAKHADLRTNTTALSKLDDIVSRGRGIDKTKLKAALDGDLGDVLNKATGDDLTNILNRLDTKEVTGAHLDEITSRLGNSDYGIKQDLLDHPEWFETFDDILQNPGRYWERISQSELVKGSALQTWAQGKWWKDLRETAQAFQNNAGLNKVKQVFSSNYGSQITLKISKAGEEPFEIVADYLAKDANDVFHIIDTKYTTLDNFDLTKSLTPNQGKAFPWIKNGDELTIEVRAVDSKLEDLGLLQGDLIDVGNIKIDIYKSAQGNSNVVESILNY